MVDTQQLLAWPVGFSLSAVELSELGDGSHSLDMKHLSTLDYASISSSPSIPSSLSPPLASSISSAGLAYDPSPCQGEEQLTHMDYANMHSYRMEPDTHSESRRCDGIASGSSRSLFQFAKVLAENSFNYKMYQRYHI